jgi:hypothetical protein
MRLNHAFVSIVLLHHHSHFMILIYGADLGRKLAIESLIWSVKPANR